MFAFFPRVNLAILGQTCQREEMEWSTRNRELVLAKRLSGSLSLPDLKSKSNFKSLMSLFIISYRKVSFDSYQDHQCGGPFDSHIESTQLHLFENPPCHQFQFVLRN